MTPPAPPHRRPAIIVISSHVARGTVGNRAAALALEALGLPVWIVPTVMLPWHPGHTLKAGSGHRVVPTPEDFERLLDDLAGSPWIGEVGAVLSGYLGDPSQVEPVARLVEATRAANPDAMYVLDPVSGDNGRLYVAEEQAALIASRLLPLADVVTPNPFELSLLANCPVPDDNIGLVKAARQLGVTQTLVTSAHPMKSGSIANLLIEERSVLLAEHPLLSGPPNGLGDLTAALLTGNKLLGGKGEALLARTTASVYETMAQSAQHGADELLLELCLGSLTAPRARVDTRSLLVR